MDIKPIRSYQDYQEALNEIDRLWGSEPGPEGDKLDVLIVLVEDYEKKNFRSSKEDPIETIIYYMESRGLSRADLEKYIGSRARVSEVLNRKRHLTLRMIRNLSDGLGIPAEILVQPYKLDTLESEDTYTFVFKGSEYAGYQIMDKEENHGRIIDILYIPDFQDQYDRSRVRLLS
jgi:HTH-type transcriptional regulator / antitoxin HigA